MWPEWWEWDLELTPHVKKRMVDRSFTEVDLRAMMESATHYEPDIEEGRWIVRTRHGTRAWAVIVEPDDQAGVLSVITAFPLG